MNDEFDPAVVAAYRAAAAETPSAALDARVFAARPSAAWLDLWVWAQAAAALLLIGSSVVLGLRGLSLPPSPNDPRYYGFFVETDTSTLLTLDAMPDLLTLPVPISEKTDG